jgi:hypothetical protein
MKFISFWTQKNLRSIEAHFVTVLIWDYSFEL